LAILLNARKYGVKIPELPHSWRVAPQQAIAIQRRLASGVHLAQPAGTLHLIAGVDVALSRDRERCIAACVLWDIREQSTREQAVATVPVRFPYVPGLLSFREAPAILAALRKLDGEPDAIMCDGQGLAHPRRFGLACHIGVICNRPAIGCAKSRLLGEHREPGVRRGSRTALMDGNERIGTVLRTRAGVRPLYVSVGHLIDLVTAERMVLESAVGYRLPEPTRLADKLVRRVRSRR
jgi:deoxyribonuclease V